MIDGLKRKFVKSIDKDPWDADQEFAPEVEEASELPTDSAVLLAATEAIDTSGSNEIDTAEYYKGLVRTAIENGGKYHGHQIPIPWLRMILAGLESRHVDPEMMWYDAGAAALDSPLPKTPSYEELFPSEADFPTGPGPR